MSVPECGAGGLLEGGMSMNSTPGNGFSRAIVWLFSGVRVLAWFVLCGVCGLVRSAGPLVGLVVLEGRMGHVMRMSMFGALLGFEATSLLAGWSLCGVRWVGCLVFRCLSCVCWHGVLAGPCGAGVWGAVVGGAGLLFGNCIVNASILQMR